MARAYNTRMLMSPRSRNLTGHYTPFCGACCDSDLHNSKSIKRARREAKRRERRVWKQELAN